MVKENVSGKNVLNSFLPEMVIREKCACVIARRWQIEKKRKKSGVWKHKMVFTMLDVDLTE